MATKDTCAVLADPKNGVVTPLYFDRQVIRATDLTLDRASHDAELARMRRLMHGWGVVSGLIPTVEGSGDIIHLSPGYGISPTGQEVFLSQEISLKEVRERMVACCAGQQPGCDLIDEKSMKKAKAISAETLITAWLIVRATSQDSTLRPGVPAGCAHPANALLPSRRCNGIQVELLCDLPDTRVLPTPECSDFTDYFCPSNKHPNGAMYPYPPLPGAVDDYLVLGRLQLFKQELQFHPVNRRAVLPVSVMQDWLISCFCPLLDIPQPVPTPDPGPKPDTGFDWSTFLDKLHDSGIAIEWQDRGPSPNPEFADLRAPPMVAESKELFESVSALGHIGPADFIKTKPKKLAEGLGVDPLLASSFQSDLARYARFWTGKRPKVASPSWKQLADLMAKSGITSEWSTADGVPEFEDLQTGPVLAKLIPDPSSLDDLGFNSPADLFGINTNVLAEKLNIGVELAQTIRGDLARFSKLWIKEL